MDERRVHPEHQLGVSGRVGRSGREAAELGLRRSRNAAVYRAHNLAGSLRLGLGAEGDQIERPQGADQPAPQIALVVGVLDDARSDQRVRHLEQHGRTAAEERR